MDTKSFTIVRILKHGELQKFKKNEAITLIENWLQEVERKHHINILFAAETGSRAWGGATEQSDYDVRFIFIHQDIKKYLSLTKVQETIDFQSPFDAQGWDVFKTFTLLQKSNPSLLEWAVSPILYRDEDQFSKKICTLVEESYSLFSLFQHYIHLIARNLKEIRDKDFNERRQKQLIQATRAFLLAKTILFTRTVPFDALYSSFAGMVPDKNGLVSFYNELMTAKKKQHVVHSVIIKDSIILLETELVLLKKHSHDLPKGKNITDKLDQWIWKLLHISE